MDEHWKRCAKARQAVKQTNRALKLSGGKRIRKGVDRGLVMSLRKQGLSWAEIHEQHPATVRDMTTGKMRAPSRSSIWRTAQKGDE